jgi:hypothetical protein
MPEHCLVNVKLNYGSKIPQIAELPASNSRKKNVFLVSDQPYAKGDAIFFESAFIEDNIKEISLEDHKLNDNERWSWNITRQLLSKFDRKSLEKFIATQFATSDPKKSILWEKEDDIILNQLTTQYHKDGEKDLVYELYDIIVTNNIVSRTICIEPQNKSIDNMVARIEPSQHGLYLLLSRMNHSCEPNTIITELNKFHDVDMKPVVSKKTGQPIGYESGSTRCVVALRDIKKGEPLVYDYVSSIPLDLKRNALFESWQFRCACSRCIKLCGLLSCNRIGSMTCPCHKIKYCSKSCQRVDWNRHKSSEHETI